MGQRGARVEAIAVAVVVLTPALRNPSGVFESRSCPLTWSLVAVCPFVGHHGGTGVRILG